MAQREKQELQIVQKVIKNITLIWHTAKIGPR